MATKATGAGSASSPAPAAQATPRSEGQPAPAPRAEAVQGRSIYFSLWATKTGGPKLNLTVERATRAEVEAALARIESLVKPDMERSTEHGPIEGQWRLKPYKGSEEDLLTFKVSQVMPAEARQLF
jgi:hypothetical protein